MSTAIKCGLVGFVAGLVAALALTAIGNARVITPQELRVLWPTALLGVDFAGWADGNAWDFLRLLLAFLGNGVVYAAFACCFGALLEFVRR